MKTATRINKFDSTANGSLYDRGRADAYYKRNPDPHWWPEGTYNGERVIAQTEREIAEYLDGYDDQVKSGVFKY